MTLKDLPIGKTATVTTVGGEGALRQHFLDMGLIPKADVTMVKFAPMGDPVEVRIHGYELTLRLADAEKIEIDKIRDTITEPMRPQDARPIFHPGLGEGGKYHVQTGEPLPPGETLTFALAGNQNCGKTTLFNQLTGSNQHVGNFPGVTVDRKDGAIRGVENTLVTDLPGIYSMSPYSSEELVTRRFVLDEHPRGIINIVDATNIERNLYLTMQLMELDVPMVLALNMMDEVRQNGGSVRVNEMEEMLGIPVVPGSEGAVDVPAARKVVDEITLPIMLKAEGGGGGRGIFLVREKSELEDAFFKASAMAQASFGNPRLYVEKYLEQVRHIEIQVIADQHGNVFAFDERDCSVQRNHQKMIEESPSPLLDADEGLRRRMMDDAVKAARAVGYTSAGTIEFLMDTERNYYFMEMNTRIQVEHCVTEMVTHTDLVGEMIRVAAGEPLSFSQDDIVLRGHAIECRINAETPEKNFMPSPGTISQMHLPGGNGVRVDTAAYDGFEISPYYDSMIAKIIVQGRNRTEAIAKMRTALEEMVVVGVNTNLDFQYAIMENETFRAGLADTGFIEQFLAGEV